jgi:hypothetical protein
MDPDLFAPLLALVGLGTFSLIGLRMLLNYRVKRLQAQGGGGAQHRELAEGLAELRDQVYLLRGDVADLHERVDFTERVLARGRDEAKLPQGN